MRDAAAKLGVWMERRLPELYLVFAASIVGLLCFATAPFFAPDEPAQSLRAIALGHGVLIATPGPDDPGAVTDAGVVHVLDRFDDMRMKWERTAGDFHDRSEVPVSEMLQLQQADKRWWRQTIFDPFWEHGGVSAAVVSAGDCWMESRRS